MARHLAFAHADKRRRPYWRDSHLLSKTFTNKQQEGILTIGRDVWTRQQIVDDLHCGNFIAAQNLSKVARKLEVRSLEDLASQYSLEDLFSQTGVGITTMYVLMCALEAKHRDPMKWIDRKPDEVVTLDTEKHRVRAKKTAA